MVLEHLGVQPDCGSVSSARSGRGVLFRVSSAPLIETGRWPLSLADQWDSRLAELEARAEHPA